MIAIERKRTERSKAPFLLMLLEAVNDESANKNRTTLHKVIAALLSSSRDTDLIGWYQEGVIVGAMFTGLVVNDKRAILDTFLTKVTVDSAGGVVRGAVQSGTNLRSPLSRRLGSRKAWTAK